MRGRRLGRPLVVFEDLRLDYPWASQRLHQFMLEGMAANAESAGERGLNYWPFVEARAGEGRGLLKRLAERAALVVTDDFPCFIVPGQSDALARKVGVPVVAVDSNSVVPLSLLGSAVYAAAHLRPRIHKAFAEAWAHRATGRLRLRGAAAKAIQAPFETWHSQDVTAFVARLPLDAAVPRVAGTPGGTPAAQSRMRAFLKKRLRGYAEERSEPRSLAEGHVSGLSPYLHFGHISIEEVAEAVLRTAGRFTPEDLRVHNRGRREGFFSDDPDVNAFLDEVLTWRDVGFNWHWTRRDDARSLETALPKWALATLRAHASDPRSWLYTPEELEAAETHDPLWNAAQRQLVRGRHHPQPAAHALGQEDARVVALARGGLPDARAPQQQVRPGRTRPQLLHRHPLVLRPVRPALGARASRGGQRAVHVVREHRPQVRPRPLLLLRVGVADHRGRARGEGSPPAVPGLARREEAMKPSLMMVPIAAALSLGAAPPSGGIVRVAWLQGCWEAVSGGRVVEEQWTAPRGDSMVGLSRTLSGGTLTAYELIVLREQGDRLTYRPILRASPRPCLPR